jgi:hypothetical protein
LQYATTYYVRVRTNFAPTWGPIRSFSTLPVPMTSVGNMSNIPLEIGLYTTFVPGASTYTFEINTDISFNPVTSIIRTANIRYIWLDRGLLNYATTYYVRVKTDLSSSWGSISTLTTISAPTTFLTAPSNGASNVPLVTGLYANFTPGATTYFFEINTDASFNAATAINRTSSSRYVSLNSGVLQYATTYYVRVRTNFAPTWGTVISFSTIPAPSGRMQAATESTVSSECQVWPNPFTERLNILVNSPQPEPLELQLSDLQGRTIHQSASYWTNEANQISENLPAGIYILQARWGNETKIVKVFKQR